MKATLRPATAVLAFLLAVLVASVLAFVVLHRSHIYPFVGDPFDIAGFSPEMVTVPDAPELAVQVFRADDPAAAVMIYFMGNVGSLQLHRLPLARMRDAGFHVVAMPYRGGGGVPGRSTEARLIADALAVFDWTQGWAQGPLVLRGYSLGTGLALAVAAGRDADAVILTAPFTRMCTLVAREIVLPACLIPGVDRWDSLSWAAEVIEPVLLLHGDADQVLAQAMAESLARELREAGAPVTMVWIAGGDLDTQDADPAYDAAVTDFMAQLGGP